MPEICYFEGLHIYMYNELGGRHFFPHVHVSYSGRDSVFRIPDGRLMQGHLPPNKEKVLKKWLCSREKELMELW